MASIESISPLRHPVRDIADITAAPWKSILAESMFHLRDLPAHLMAGYDTLDAVTDYFPMRINPYMLGLIDTPDGPIGRQLLPRAEELDDLDRESDPLAEEDQSPAPQIIHRYPGRVVFLVSNQCAVHCRFCMRKRRVADGRQVPRKSIDQGIDYIRHHPQVNEVVLSGGDPLMRSDMQLVHILETLRGIPHVRVLRIHSRIPVVLPQRITPVLAGELSRCHPLYLNLHCNHPAEITPEVAAACRLLADAGIPLGSQTVLLKGVNDEARVLQELFESLLQIRVRPYYLHQLDRVPGTAHFRVPVERSIGLLRELRGRLSGMGIPHLMVDLPGGGGKVALGEASVVDRGKEFWKIRNWQGQIYDYPVRQ